MFITVAVEIPYFLAAAAILAPDFSSPTSSLRCASESTIRLRGAPPLPKLLAGRRPRPDCLREINSSAVMRIPLVAKSLDSFCASANSLTAPWTADCAALVACSTSSFEATMPVGNLILILIVMFLLNQLILRAVLSHHHLKNYLFLIQFVLKY